MILCAKKNLNRLLMSYMINKIIWRCILRIRKINVDCKALVNRNQLTLKGQLKILEKLQNITENSHYNYLKFQIIKK
jgi:hypothetical protein